MSDYIGIDYGLGGSNIDKKTGIRYGVISMHDLIGWAWDEFDADYGPAACGHCGNEAVEYDDEKHGEYEHSGYGCHDFACEVCEKTFDGEEAYGEEPRGWVLDDGEYLAEAHSDGDCFVIKSPYYTHAAFCSPCAPGAGHLGSPHEDGPKTYCFGHEWFTGGVAPYAVYRVDSGQRVYPTVPQAQEKGNDIPPNE